MTRQRVRPFHRRQIELVQTFADQAVIAIENVRLFDEVQARTRDLTEALQQQTATAEVLKVISRSAFDLDAVFDALLASAVSLIGGRAGTICVRDGDVFRYRAVAEGRDSAMWRYLSEHPRARVECPWWGVSCFPASPKSFAACSPTANSQRPCTRWRAYVPSSACRCCVTTGSRAPFLVARFEPGPFDQRQIELLQTFADQAVIAIENVRLFDEVQARTRDLIEALSSNSDRRRAEGDQPLCVQSAARLRHNG